MKHFLMAYQHSHANTQGDTLGPHTIHGNNKMAIFFWFKFLSGSLAQYKEIYYTKRLNQKQKGNVKQADYKLLTSLLV